MTREESIYTSLCVLFSVLIVMGNLIYQKFVLLPILPFHTFELSVGAILYPLTFLLTDLITEFYGKGKANFCVRLAISMNIFVACVISGMDHLESTTWSKIDDTTFHKVFGLYRGGVRQAAVRDKVDGLILNWKKYIVPNYKMHLRH